MDNMAFYEFITFVIDFVGARVLCKNSFHRLLKHKKSDFYDGPTEGPTDDYYDFCV